MVQYRKKPAGKDFYSRQISQRYYRLEYNARSDKSVLMNGVDVEIQFTLDFTFQLIRTELTHRDSSYDLSASELEVTYERKAGSILDIPKAENPYFTKKQLNAPRMTIDFTKDKLVFEAGTHTITLNGDNTDLVTPIIYVMELV